MFNIFDLHGVFEVPTPPWKWYNLPFQIWFSTWLLLLVEMSSAVNYLMSLIGYPQVVN